MVQRLGLKAAPAIGRTTERRHARTVISGRDRRATKAIGRVGDDSGDLSPAGVAGWIRAPDGSGAIGVETLEGVAFLDQA
jgi:hypothetical protein